MEKEQYKLLMNVSEGFKKIYLNNLKKSSGVQNQVAFVQTRTNGIKIIFFPLFILLGILLFVSFFGIYLPFQAVYRDGQKTIIVARELYSYAKKQNLEGLKSKTQELKGSLENVHTSYEKLLWLQVIPYFGTYVRDGKHAIQASLDLTDALQITVDTLLPYADLLGLKGKSTFVSGSADERIRTAVTTLEKMLPNIDSISQKIAGAKEELDNIDATRYPEKIGSIGVRSKLVSGKKLFEESATLFIEAKPLLQKLPDLLGNNDSKRYLILFQNDAELRATGGFITAFALFKVDKGKLTVERADDIYKLDQAKKKKYPAPTPISKYHKNVFTFELRDANLSPDYKESMSEFEKMLYDAIPDFPKTDGIISLDTHVLVSAIKILGDFSVYGRTFSAENDKRCDCPKAIYELEDYSTRPVAYVREERKDIIGVLLYQLLQKALGVSPSKYWGQLSQMFFEEARQKHVLFFFKDTDSQKGIEAINIGGRIIPVKTDYLHINDVNFAGAKSNLFVRSSVKQEIRIDNNGLVTKTLTITYKNPSPASNCNLEAGQLCLNGILRNWLRIYVPLGSKITEFTGSEKETVTYEDLGKTVFEGFFTVKPQGASTIKITYTLPYKLKRGEMFTELIQKQPGTDAIAHTIIYNGKEIDQFTLITDKEISFRL